MMGSQPQKVALKDTITTVRKLMTDQSVQTYIGSMMTTQGILVLLFSQRLNKEFSILVSSTELSPVLTKVYETLALLKEEAK